MMAITARFAGLVRRTRAVRRTEGPRAAASYAARLVMAKASVVLRQIASLRQRRAIAAMVADARAGGTVMVSTQVTGGLGDAIVVARFLRDLGAVTGGIGFEIFTSQPVMASWIFGAVPGFRTARYDLLFDHLSSSYDVTLTTNQFVAVHAERTRWRTLDPELATVLTRMMRYRPEIEVYIQHHPRLDNGLARKAVFAGADRRTYLHHIAGIPYGGDGLPVAVDASAPGRFGLTGRPYVTVHNGFDAGFVITSARATKCYPHFDRVVAGLKAALPDLLVVQLGTSTSEPIPGVDLDLIGRTSLRESGGIIAGARLHIDNEGGLVHLAAALGVRSAVVFGPTPSDYFGYPGNIAIDPPVCGDCWWIDEHWMSRCPRGLAVPECTHAQAPEAVLARLLPALTRAPEPPTQRAAVPVRAAAGSHGPGATGAAP